MHYLECVQVVCFMMSINNRINQLFFQMKTFLQRTRINQSSTFSEKVHFNGIGQFILRPTLPLKEVDVEHSYSFVSDHVFRR